MYCFLVAPKEDQDGVNLTRKSVRSLNLDKSKLQLVLSACNCFGKLDPKTPDPLIPPPLIVADETAPTANKIQDLKNMKPELDLAKLTKIERELIGRWDGTHH